VPAPLVSICIPTRNRCQTLRQTLDSIRAQNYAELDILVSDNCSDDATEQVCKEAMSADERIRYVRHPVNIGLHGNHNFCIDSGRGEFLCIFHDHDKREPTIVSEYVGFLESHPTVGVVCSDWDLIDDQDRRLGIREYRGPMVTAGCEYIARTIRSGRSSVGIPGSMARSTALVESRFGLDAPIGFGDFPLWFRLAEKWDVGHIHNVLWSWRQNRESHSARPIVAIAEDYARNVGGYCAERLARRPADADLVAEWRRDLRRYLFWALTYEVALHFRKRGHATDESRHRSLFEMMEYRLTDDQFAQALEQMKRYRTGPYQSLVCSAVKLSIALRLTAGLGWLARYQATMRSWLSLE
jgi:glycosyltransferase involved in cell wall biosynthesis